MLPLYLAFTAVASGAYDHLVRFPDRQRRRLRWELDVAERIASPTPLAVSIPIGFPGTPAGPVPLGRLRPEPSEAGFWAWNLSRRKCRPKPRAEFVLADLLAHSGYENDPLAVSAVLATLRIMRTSQVPK